MIPHSNDGENVVSASGTTKTLAGEDEYNLQSYERFIPQKDSNYMHLDTQIKMKKSYRVHLLQPHNQTFDSSERAARNISSISTGSSV